MQQELGLWKDPEGEENEVLPTGEYIKRELAKRGWGQADLAEVIDRPLPTVNEIIKGKRAVTPEMAVALGRAFNTPSALWAHREAAYRLSLVKHDDQDTEKKARVYEMAPIKDLQRRGWINPEATSAADLAAELVKFMGDDALSCMQVPSALARQTFSAVEFSNAQRAWLMQGSHLARKLNARTYRRDAFESALPKLRKHSTKPELAAKVPIFLAELGVRLVVIEDLPRTRIDGAAFFLDSDKRKPVILMSVRLDRMDNFWHTLGHEVRHIINEDPLSLDADLFGENKQRLVNDMERRADIEAADWLVPPADLKSFVLRSKPWFARESIEQFASRMGVHPCIVIGQLQATDVIGWDRHADVRPKIREHILATAMCDGYGKRIN